MSYETIPYTLPLGLPLTNCINSVLFLLTSMCQTKGPQSKVGRGVRNTSQAVFYSVNSLMNEYLSKVKLQM